MSIPVLSLLMLASLASADVQPAIDLIIRNFGASAAAAFNLSLSNSHCGAEPSPCFALSQTGNTVRISGSSISELTYGIGWYTRYTCGLTVGWKHGGGSHTNASSWPCSSSLAPVTKHRAVPYTYEDNVCTHSYSYVWYDQAAWTAHIDWMALQGVNVFLALTGQELIQYKVFRQFGLDDRQIREFFNGPAYLTWSRGQSMQSVGSSALPEGGSSGLPMSWMEAQWALQKQILQLTRSLGIIGVLPAFQGNMPPQVKALYPAANISTTHPLSNDTRGNCAWVASTDPLFGKVADLWMETLIADFGTDHWYQCDGFFTGLPPPWYYSEQTTGQITDEPAYSKGVPVTPDPNWTPVWEAAWGGISRTDPQAKWLYQGWAIRGWSDAAGASRIKALYDAVPHGQWIPLDMDIQGIWKYWGNYSFFGAPFIWTTLHNMGGNDGIKGDMRMLQELPAAALAANASIIGTGATPEGIDQNPAYYEYTLDTAWFSTPQPLHSWFAQYSSRRYGGSSNPNAAAAWDLLRTGPYESQAGGWHDDTGVEWMLSGVPNPVGVNIHDLSKAWGLLVAAGAEIDPMGMDTLNYDIVNTGREVLAQLITVMEQNLTVAVKAIDKHAATAIAAELMEVYSDLDLLLGCDFSFLIGPWIAAARGWANSSDAPVSYYEWQAKSQVSTWWPVAPSARKLPETYKAYPTLDNYANKHWNGLVRDFYAKRVQCYVNQMEHDLPSSPPPPSACKLAAEVPNAYLRNYPLSLGSGGTVAPATWPYDTSQLDSAQMWCCNHSDCGGVTHQNNRFEVRAENTPVAGDGASSYPRLGVFSLNQTNLTACAVTAEMDFTQAVDVVYSEKPTSERTLSLSSSLLDKYATYL